MEHFSHDIWHFAVQVSAIVLVGATIVVLWRDFAVSRRLPGRTTWLARIRNRMTKWVFGWTGRDIDLVDMPSAIDTLFVLPDISGYSGLVALYGDDVDKAREPVFALMNAMMDGVGTRLKLSKVDGDAVLFYADAASSDPEGIGHAVTDLFEAFDAEKRRLVARHRGDQDFASSIDRLDVKVLIHRGKAARYEFGGSTDHFGAAVTMIYKLLKNDVRKRRYVLRTKPSMDAVAFAHDWPLTRSVQRAGELGQVDVDIFDVPAMVPKKRQLQQKHSGSATFLESVRLAGTA